MKQTNATKEKKMKTVTEKQNKYILPTKREHESFSNFQVDFVKQFSAIDIMYAVQKTLEEPQMYHRYSDDEKNQWFIKQVLETIGFYK